MNYQLHFADATGDAVVVSAGDDDEIAFTRIGFDSGLVSTNINVADSTRDVYDCWRYSTAMSMLTAITAEDNLTVDSCRDVLDAVHQNGIYATKYSNVFDCVNRDIYLWYDRDYTQVVIMNLDEELAFVQPGVIGYFEQNPLFSAYGFGVDMHYRKIALSNLFEPSASSPTIYQIFIVIGFVVLIMLIIVIVMYQRRRSLK